MRGSYQTKQRKQILDYLAKHSKGSASAKEIHAAFLGMGHAVSLATIYRQLKHMVQENTIKKILAADNSGMRFQYVSEATEAFYMKCESCGKLEQMDCELLVEMADHVDTEHGFQINTGKSILYGQCESCKHH